MFVIYSITNKINNKRYIGVTTNFYNRKRVHLWAMKNLKHKNEKLLKAVKKYGFENFSIDIIEEPEGDWIEALKKENYYINFYDSHNNGYNRSDGFDGSSLYKPSEEILIKQSERMKGNKYWLGRKHTDEEKKKISEANKGKFVSEESRRKMSEARKGKMTGKDNPFYGKHHSKETMDIIKEKIGKKVMCVETGQIFISVSECSKEMQCDRRGIQKVCVGKQKHCGGYTFKFVD